MAEAVAPTRSRRLPFWTMIIALVICALAGVFVLLWFKLPTWAPEWVVEHSPWVDPIVRAVEENPVWVGYASTRLAERGGAVAPAMITYLETDREEAVALSCRVLKAVVNPDMITPVVRRLRAGIGGGARVLDLANLTEALSRQPPDLVMDALLPIPEGDEEVARLMIAVVGMMNDQRAVDALRAIIWESEDSTRDVMKEMFGRSAMAASSLTKSPVPTAKAVLIRALEDPEAHVRLRAVSGLTSPIGRKKLLDPELLMILAQRLKDDDVKVKEAAAVAAAFNPLPDAETELMAWLGSPAARERSLGLTGLGAKHASEAAITAIAKCLHDPDPKVQRQAINALGRTANPLVVPFLLEVFPSLSGTLKREVLSKLKDKDLNQVPQVFPFLVTVMDDTDLEVAKAAGTAMWRIHHTEDQRPVAESANEGLQKRLEQGEAKPTSP